MPSDKFPSNKPEALTAQEKLTQIDWRLSTVSINLNGVIDGKHGSITDDTKKALEDIIGTIKEAEAFCRKGE
jgi:hypothetical protein